MSLGLQFTDKVLFTLIHPTIKKQLDFPKDKTVFKGGNRYTRPDRYRRLYLSFYSFQGYLKKTDYRFDFNHLDAPRKTHFHQMYDLDQRCVLYTFNLAGCEVCMEGYIQYLFFIHNTDCAADLKHYRSDSKILS